MTAVATEPTGTAAADPQGDDPQGEVPGRRRRRLDRETTLLLVVPPVLIAAGFAGYVVWRLTADLDSIAESVLRWDSIIDQTLRHLQITVAAAIVVVGIAVPLGIAMTRPRLRRAAPVVVGIANAGQAAPSVGLVVLLAIWLGFGFWTGVLAVSLYGLLPVLRNTITGLQGVDPTLVEAGRGMGMSSRSVLLRVELPLALPVIMAGVRTSLVLIVGTAALLTFINAGGLGGPIVAGINLFRTDATVAAAVLVALLALLVEWLGRLLEVLLRPKGL